VSAFIRGPTFKLAGRLGVVPEAELQDSGRHRKPGETFSRQEVTESQLKRSPTGSVNDGYAFANVNTGAG
jgi:hypothetical protein